MDAAMRLYTEAGFTAAVLALGRDRPLRLRPLLRERPEGVARHQRRDGEPNGSSRSNGSTPSSCPRAGPVDGSGAEDILLKCLQPATRSLQQHESTLRPVRLPVPGGHAGHPRYRPGGLQDRPAARRSRSAVFEAFSDLTEQAIPVWLLERAYGVVVVPRVVKVALSIGGRGGKGVMAVRNPDGTWSNPMFVTLGGVNFGFQFGVQSTDVVLVLMSRQSVEGIAGGKVTLGADASVAAGPLGRSSAAATDATLQRAGAVLLAQFRPVRGRRARRHRSSSSTTPPTNRPMASRACWPRRSSRARSTQRAGRRAGNSRPR